MAAARGLLAIALGFVSAVAAVLGCTAIGVFLFFGGDFAAPPTWWWLLLNLAYTTGAGVLGGWVCAVVARTRPLVHAGVLAGVMLALGSGSGGDSGPATGVPAWYGTTVTLLGAFGVLAGAYLRTRRSPEPADSGASTLSL